MNVLVISNNYIVIKDGKCWCDPNFYYILKRFSYIGTISLCAISKKDAPTYIELDFVSKDNIYFIEKRRVLSSHVNKKIMEAAIIKSDLVIGYNPCVNAEAAFKISKRHKKKYMTYLVACVWDSLWNHSIYGKICAPIRYFSVREVTRKSDYVLYVTNRFLQERYPNTNITLGCSDVQIDHIDDEVLSTRLKRLEHISMSDTIKIVTTAAVYVKYKGQRFVIKALGELKRKKKTNFHYYLIGGGDQNILKNIADIHNVKDQVTFLGLQPHHAIPDILDDMDVYIQPSLQEGLPRSVVEAMSRGLLCIGARTGAIPELIKDDYIVQRKSVKDIVSQLENLNAEKLKYECVRNITVAKEYENDKLERKRRRFFDIIINDIKLKSDEL